MTGSRVRHPDGRAGTVVRIAAIELRRRRFAALVVAVTMGVGMGVALTALAGAWRNHTAYDRLLSESNASDLLANPNFGSESSLDVERLSNLPQVEAVGKLSGLLITPDKNGKPDLERADYLQSIGAERGLFDTVDRPKVIAGRLPADDRLDEVAVTPEAKEAFHLEIGDVVVLHAFTLEEIRAAEAGEDPGVGRLFRPRVVGVVRSNYDVVTDDASRTAPVYFSEASQQLRAEAYYGLAIRLRHGASDVPAFQQAAEQLIAPKARAEGDTIVFQTRSDLVARVDRVTRPQTVALLAFALVIGLAVLFVAGQALVRHLDPIGDDVPILGAMGATRRTIFQVLLIRVACITLLGVVTAMGVAVALSPLTPIGLAREIEPHPGLSVDLPVLGVGTATFAIAFLVVTLRPVWLIAARRAGSSRDRVTSLPPRLTRLLAARPTVSIGVHRAIGSTGSRSGGSSAVVGATVAAVWLVAATVFASSLTHFVDTPRAWGWSWDAMVALNTSDADPSAAPIDRGREVAAILRKAPEVSVASEGTTTEITLGGSRVTSLAMTPGPTGMPATVAAGRTPRSAGEVALGIRTMDRLHVGLGDVVTGADREGRPFTVRVVGQAVFPGLASYPGEDPTALGSGALITMSGFARYGADLSGPVYFVRLRSPLTPETRAALRRLTIPGGDPAVQDISQRPNRPSDVKGLIQVRTTPYLLAAVLAALAMLTIGHTLITDVRRRRRELAVLKAVGMIRRQLASVVAWHATTVTAIGLLIGVPGGIVVGRMAWKLTADRLGVPGEPTVPLGLICVVVLGVIAVTNALAAFPAIVAARTPAAETLREE